MLWGLQQQMKFCLEAPAYWQVILFIQELKIFKRKHARSVNRICPECGHLFQKGLSEEQLTDVIEKEKEDDMSSEQIDRVFEKVDTLSIEEIKAYDSELDDFLRKQYFGCLAWL